MNHPLSPNHNTLASSAPGTFPSTPPSHAHPRPAIPQTFTTQVCSGWETRTPPSHFLATIWIHPTPSLLSSCFLLSFSTPGPLLLIHQSPVPHPSSFSSDAPPVASSPRWPASLSSAVSTLQSSSLDDLPTLLLLCPEKCHTKLLEELNKLMPL